VLQHILESHALSAINTKFVLKGSVVDADALNGPHDVHIRGNYAYVAGKDYPGTSSVASFAIVDISNPANPTVVGSIENFTDAQTVEAFDDNTAYLGHDGGISVINISTKSSPSVSTTIGGSGVIQDVNGWEKIGNTLIVASKNGYVHSIDVSTLTSPSINGSRNVRTSDNVYWPHDISIFGDYFITVSNSSGAAHQGVHIAVYRWADSGTLRAVGDWTMEDSITDSTFFGANRVRVDIANDIAYVASHPTLGVIDVSTPSAISTLETMIPWSSVHTNGLELDTANDLLWAGSANGIVALDISIRQSPVRIGLFADSDLYGSGKELFSAHDLSRSGNYVYATAQDGDALIVFEVLW
jgi:hypothetical protein